MGSVAPVLATMGFEPLPVPTAVLSCHTGGLGEPVRMNVGDYAARALTSYKELGLEVSCVLASYLPDAAARDAAAQAFSQWPAALKLLDPAMADNGKLYRGMEGAVEPVRELAARADLVLPNLTEACLLLDEPVPEGPVTPDWAFALAERLRERLGTGAIVTGLPMGKNIGVCAAGRTAFLVQKPRLARSFPGTGDLFAAVLAGSLMRGNALSAAADMAAEFVWQAISHTASTSDTRLGVWYEPLLARLAPVREE